MKHKIDLEIKSKTKGKSDIDTKLLEIFKTNQENKMKEVDLSTKKVFRIY